MKKFAILALCLSGFLGCKSNNPYAATVPYHVSYNWQVVGGQSNGFGSILIKPGYSVQGLKEGDLASIKNTIENELAKRQDLGITKGKSPSVVVIAFSPMQPE